MTIWWATPADARRVKLLADLDDTPVPAAPLLLGFVANELWVAVSAPTGRVISDPFKPAAEVALLVLERRRQLTVPQLEQRAVLRVLRRRWGVSRAAPGSPC